MQAISRKKAMTTKVLVMASLLTGLSIILTRFISVMIPLGGLPALRFGLGGVPIIISGIMFGPIAGGLTGIVADLVGFMINPQGGYFPGFTLSAALQGIIPALLYLRINQARKDKNYTFVNVVTILMLISGVVAVMFNSNILSMNNNEIYYNNEKLSLVYMIVFGLVVLSFILIPIIYNKKKRIGMDSFYSVDKIMFVVTVVYLIVSLGLNTFWLSIMFNKGVLVFLPGRVISGLVTIPLYTSIIYTLSRFFKNFNYR